MKVDARERAKRKFAFFGRPEREQHGAESGLHKYAARPAQVARNFRGRPSAVRVQARSTAHGLINVQRTLLLGFRILIRLEGVFWIAEIRIPSARCLILAWALRLEAPDALVEFCVYGADGIAAFTDAGFSREFVSRRKITFL